MVVLLLLRLLLLLGSASSGIILGDLEQRGLELVA